tara:strand:- start:1572 stop:1805 length:234 start_codon:yes stop_codon:yes gene_type:complete
MTSVNITTEKNTVTVNGETSVVTVATQGSQGPVGPAGTSIDLSNAVDNSLLYFHEASGTLKLDNTTTKLTLVNGGNF